MDGRRGCDDIHIGGEAAQNLTAGSQSILLPYRAGGVLVVENSLIAANVTPPKTLPESIYGCTPTLSDCGGTLTSQGYNLIQDTSHCTIAGNANGNIVGVDPHLGPLQDNGGATNTQALLPGSPAIGAGNPHGCVDANGNALLTDQRGAPRPAGARCDTGAYEAQSGATASGAGGGCSTVPPQPGLLSALIWLVFPAALAWKLFRATRSPLAPVRAANR
jgi:hypothetical protein